MKQLKFNPDEDMKELEKYGFEFKEIYGWRYEYKNSNRLIDNSDLLLKPYEDINVVTFDERNVLYIHANTHMVMIPPIIYDLIKAKLLMVEDKDEM